MMPRGFPPVSFDAVLFDVDGTLVDSVDMIVKGIADTVQNYSGYTPSRELLRSIIGMPLRQQFGQLMPTPPTEPELQEMTAYTLDRFDVHRHHETWFESAIEALKVCYEGGARTALVTSKNALELSRFLPHFPGTPFITTTVCASDVTYPKPDPESARLACERLGVEPARAIMVGDSVFDLRCARGAGVSCIAVTYGAGSRTALDAENPDYLFGTPDELLAWAKTAFFQPSCPGIS